MNKTLKFDIECGDITCASEPGKFCRFFQCDVFGKSSCFIFGQLSEKDGWVQKHQDCLNNTKGETDEK